jgi:hypothetical protein
MKPVKFVLLACSVLAVLLTFVAPYINLGEGLTFTLWKLRNVNPHEALIHPYVILVAALVPAIFAGIALAQNKLPRWQSIVSLIFFAIGLFMAWAVFSKTQTHFGAQGGIGAKLMVAALLGGIGASIAGIVKPERAHAS